MPYDFTDDLATLAQDLADRRKAAEGSVANSAQALAASDSQRRFDLLNSLSQRQASDTTGQQLSDQLSTTQDLATRNAQQQLGQTATKIDANTHSRGLWGSSVWAQGRAGAEGDAEANLSQQLAQARSRYNQGLNAVDRNYTNQAAQIEGTGPGAWAGNALSSLQQQGNYGNIYAGYEANWDEPYRNALSQRLGSVLKTEGNMVGGSGLFGGGGGTSGAGAASSVGVPTGWMG